MLRSWSPWGPRGGTTGERESHCWWLRAAAEGPFHPRLTNYGLGLEIARPDRRTTIWGHSGYLPGFRSILWYVPSRDAVIVVLVNDVRAEPRDLAELAMRRLPVRES
jgi:CubicO group peptidase (beta-lactamase class C family)